MTWDMTPNMLTAAAAVCLLSTLADASAGNARLRRYPSRSSASGNHSAVYNLQKPHPAANPPWYSATHPTPPATSSSQRSASNHPVIIHTKYNGHPINATVVKITPTPTTDRDPALTFGYQIPYSTNSPGSHHDEEPSLLPPYGNHTLFYTNRWRIDNNSAPFKQVQSPADNTSLDLCLKACIQESRCAFAGYSQRRAPETASATLPIHHLIKTCSLYSSDIRAGALQRTTVSPKRLLGPDLLALVEDRMPKEIVEEFLRDKEWLRNGKEQDLAPKTPWHGHGKRAFQTRSIAPTHIFQRAESPTTSSTGSAASPTKPIQFDMRKIFFLRTRVTHGNAEFNNLYVQNPTTRTQVSTPHLTSNRSAAALFNYAFSTSSINLCCTSSNSSLGLTMIRDRDGDAYGSAILAPQVGTARMAMVIHNCAIDAGIGIVQISPRGDTQEEVEERLNHKFFRYPRPIPSKRTLQSLHHASSTFLNNSVKAIEPLCGTTGTSASLVWKNDRFSSWLVCRSRFDGEGVELRWWDVVSDRGIDEVMCAKVDLEGVGR
ncbi:hypothetical protein FKW77_009075 [Venturia effusa]|uniref:DUF7907 domain-containing protein n=1 Tax=Venturia effusa TaxID=50376 RepID=A0A517L3Z2_9PEZI|nr:hypothetical protein FKW77_009075 [Venturia effusa]